MNKIPILKIDPNHFDVKELEPARNILQHGGVIAYPTETVYGLGANIYQERAVFRVFQLKRREPGKPLSIMISTLDEVETLCQEIPPYGKVLMRTFWPGPLTFILKASENVPHYIMSRDKKIGLRFPNHPVTQALMKLHPQPVTSTSANITGERESIRAQEVKNIFGDKIDLIIDGGECRVKVPSTVLDVTAEEPKVLREGAVSLSQIQEALSGVEYEH